MGSAQAGTAGMVLTIRSGARKILMKGSIFFPHDTTVILTRGDEEHSKNSYYGKNSGVAIEAHPHLTPENMFLVFRRTNKRELHFQPMSGDRWHCTNARLGGKSPQMKLRVTPGSTAKSSDLQQTRIDCEIREYHF